MRTVNFEDLAGKVEELCISAAYELPGDVLEALEAAAQKESNRRAAGILKQLIENARIAKNERIPLCQDTGLAVVFIEQGANVSFRPAEDNPNGTIIDAINAGVERGYRHAAHEGPGGGRGYQHLGQAPRGAVRRIRIARRGVAFPRPSRDYTEGPLWGNSPGGSRAGFPGDSRGTIASYESIAQPRTERVPIRHDMNGEGIFTTHGALERLRSSVDRSISRPRTESSRQGLCSEP